MVQKFEPPLGFDPWTIKPVTSHNTYYNTLAAIAIRGPSQLLWAHQRKKSSELEFI